MKILTDISVESQIPKPEIEIISTKTRLDSQYYPIDNSFFDQFQYTDNSGNIFPYRTHPHISSELNLNKKVRYYGRIMALYQLNRRISCECGCMMDIVDEIHGEVLCPSCGLIHHQILV